MYFKDKIQMHLKNTKISETLNLVIAPQKRETSLKLSFPYEH